MAPYILLNLRETVPQCIGQFHRKKGPNHSMFFHLAHHNPSASCMSPKIISD